MIPRPSKTNLIVPRASDLITPAHIPPPNAWGMPSQFDEWRDGQWDAVQRILDMDKRFLVLCLPTGAGKSACAMAAAKISERRTVVLTSTLGLTDQYRNAFGVDDFSHDIRGMANYRCDAANELGIDPDTRVAQAPCQMGYACPLKMSGCGYYDAYRKAQRAPITHTTYQAFLWDFYKGKDALHQAPWEAEANADGIDGSAPRWPIVQMTVCDEATEAKEEIERAIGVDISRRDCMQLGIDWPRRMQFDEWSGWAREERRTIVQRLAAWESKLKAKRAGFAREFKLLRDFKRKLDRLSQAKADEGWVMDEQSDRRGGGSRRKADDISEDDIQAVRFVPLEPGRYAEKALWRGVEKIVLMSATIRPKTCENLGIKPDDMMFVEYPSSFPVKRRPIIVVPTVQVNHRTEQEDFSMRIWLDRIDSIIEARLDRKGVVLPVSYARAEFLKANSRFGHLMITHNSHDRAEKIAMFKESAAPSVLVSPSVGTGHDFADDLARWVIIAKLPFASVQDKIVKARQEHDPEYQTFMVAQELVQYSGRAMRSEDDFCEVFIVDDSFGNWFYRRAAKFFPKWYTDAIVWAQAVPEPLELESGLEISQ